MKALYLAAAIVGAIVPYIFFIEFMGEYGLNIARFTAAAFPNPAASGLTSDLLLSSFVFWAFMFHRNRFAHGPQPLLFVALNLLIGLSCALPAYLYAMELGRKPLDRARE